MLTGVIINSVAVLIGGGLGLLFKKGIPEKINTSLMMGLGLCVLYQGIIGALKSENTLVMIIAISIGVVIGEIIDIDKGLNKLGNFLQNKVAKNSTNGKFAEGFVTSTLFICIGAMAIVGAIESGMENNHSIYISKAVVDGVVVFLMATTLGVGCMFSALAVFVYQSILTLSSSVIAQYLTEPMIAEMSATGSLIIIAIGLNMLKITNIKVGNFILAPFLAAIITIIL